MQTQEGDLIDLTDQQYTAFIAARQSQIAWGDRDPDQEITLRNLFDSLVVLEAGLQILRAPDQPKGTTTSQRRQGAAGETGGD